MSTTKVFAELAEVYPFPVKEFTFVLQSGPDGGLILSDHTVSVVAQVSGAEFRDWLGVDISDADISTDGTVTFDASVEDDTETLLVDAISENIEVLTHHARDGGSFILEADEIEFVLSVDGKATVELLN